MIFVSTVNGGKYNNILPTNAKKSYSFHKLIIISAICAKVSAYGYLCKIPLKRSQF